MGTTQGHDFLVREVTSHADLRQDPHGQDHHPRGRVLRHHRCSQVQDPGQGGYPTRPAATHLRRQAARGWPYSFRLQHLVLRLRGGAKKRKKKTYTTPKKIKHVRKKVKMSILKYYKVDSDGKIKRLRRECPNSTCGAGVFMAWHADRQYCGRCGLTYKFDGAQKA